MFENAKQPALAVAQSLGALGNLLFESALRLAQLLFQLFLRGEIGNDDADRIRLRLQLGERDEHRDFAPILVLEQIFAPDVLRAGGFEVFEKLSAQM